MWQVADWSVDFPSLAYAAEQLARKHRGLQLPGPGRAWKAEDDCDCDWSLVRTTARLEDPGQSPDKRPQQSVTTGMLRIKISTKIISKFGSGTY